MLEPLFTREEFDKAFERAIALNSFEKALTNPALGTLANLIGALGDAKSEPVYETVATALFSYMSELRAFNSAFSADLSLKKDLKPEVEKTLTIVNKSLSKLRKELPKENPNYKSVLQAVGNIFFQFHKLVRIRTSYL
ncbi:MAG: hypothetical protein IBV52_08665 [Candidatus Bathyarchaeota archaeon]